MEADVCDECAAIIVDLAADPAGLRLADQTPWMRENAPVILVGSRPQSRLWSCQSCRAAIGPGTSAVAAQAPTDSDGARCSLVITCPSATREGAVTISASRPSVDGDLTGCGAVITFVTDVEGLVDCGECGLFWNPYTETDPASRLPRISST